MRCAQCDTENRAGAHFCRKCAAKLVLVCTQCGTELPLDADFCDACAAPVGDGDTAAPAAALETIPKRIQRLIPTEYAEHLFARRGEVAKERRVAAMLFPPVRRSP